MRINNQINERLGESMETSTINRIYWRIIPLFFAMMFFNYLDRINIGFAGLRMNADLGFGPAVFGFGASIFFLGYMVLEVPSNLMLHWVGARVWLARILMTWGAVATCMAFVSSAWSFYLLRFGLGVAEAGFMPGLVLYLTYWFPARYRARAIAGYIIAGAFSAVLGGPISTTLMTYLNGLGGLHGWQWMFIAEGVPTILLGAFTLYYLTDRPADATWLTPAQRQWLQSELQAEVAAIEREGRHRLIELDPRRQGVAARGTVRLRAGRYLRHADLAAADHQKLGYAKRHRGRISLRGAAAPGRGRHHPGQPQLRPQRRSKVAPRRNLYAGRDRDARQRIGAEPDLGLCLLVYRRARHQFRQFTVLEPECVAHDRRRGGRLDRGR